MRNKLSIGFLAMVCFASTAGAQSDGKSFDAAVVLAPGMTIERNGFVFGNDWSYGALNDGDIVRTLEGASAEPYLIHTSDGSVVAMDTGTTIDIDGDLFGFNVFQVRKGYAWIAGNINRGYRLPYWFRSRLPYKAGNLTIVNDQNNFNYGYRGFGIFGNVVTVPSDSTFVIPGFR